MNTDMLYHTIFKRKSIRKYDESPLGESMLSEISNFMLELEPMHDHIKTEIKIVSRYDIKNLTPIKAPHYMIVFSENKKDYLTNAGFMLQQMDLFLSSKGIGSCWIGMAKPNKGALKSSELEFVIMLAFGKPIESLHRAHVSEFKRKNLNEITNIMGMDELFETARLAPSATNSQPWFFIKDNHKIHVYCVKTNAIKAVIYEKVNKIDMGIAICHLWIAAAHLGKRLQWEYNESAVEHSPKGFYYISTLHITA